MAESSGGLAAPDNPIESDGSSQEVAQPIGAMTAEDAMHRAGMQTKERPDPVRADAVFDPHGQHVRLERIRRASRGAAGPARVIGEVGCAPAPSVHGPPAHPDVARGLAHADPFRFDDKKGAQSRVETSSLVQRKPSE